MPRAKVKMMCLLATLLAFSVVCSAQAPKVIAQELCDRLNQANADRDLNRVFGFYDSSFVSTDEQGKSESFAEMRKRWEQEFPLFRNMSQSTTVQDVQLEAGRMVVNYKMEMSYELRSQRDGWIPYTYKETGEATWEKKAGQWKMVGATTFRAETQRDPMSVESVEEDIKDFEAAQRVAECCDSRHPH